MVRLIDPFFAQKMSVPIGTDIFDSFAQSGAGRDAAAPSAYLQHAVAHADVGLDVLGGIGSGLQLLAQGRHKHPPDAMQRPPQPTFSMR